MPRQPIELLVVSTTLNTGGAQRVTSTLLKHFDRTTVGAALCLLRDDVGYPIPNDVPVHVLGYRGLWTFPQTVRRLRSLIDELRPDVVLSNVNATNMITGWALRATRHHPAWVARMGNSPLHHDRGLRRWAARAVYPMVSQLVANSRGLAQEMVACYPFANGRVEVIENPTDFDAIDELARQHTAVQRPRSGAVVIAAGRLSRQKRYDILLRAFARVRKTVESQLWICGDGPELRSLKASARRLGIAEDVRWLGFVENPYALMRQADVFVMTSDHEGLPNALIEAQGLGLPAVATRCPHGPEEIIEHGATGLLVPVGDIELIGQALDQLLRNPALRAGMGAAASQRVRAQFDCRALTKTWEKLLLGSVSPSRAVAHHGPTRLP